MYGVQKALISLVDSQQLYPADESEYDKECEASAAFINWVDFLPANKRDESIGYCFLRDRANGRPGVREATTIKTIVKGNSSFLNFAFHDKVNNHSVDPCCVQDTLSNQRPLDEAPLPSG
jgi:hypothetical protein